MSIAPRPRRMVAALLALLLIGALAPAASAAPSSSGGTRDGSKPVATPWWVDWLEAFDLNDNKIDDEAERKAAALITTGRPAATVPVLVTFQRSLPDKAALVDVLGASHQPYFFETQPVADLNVPARNLHRLSALPGVAAVEFDMKVKPMLDVSSPATQANRGSAANAFYNGKTAEDLGYTGEGTTVAVLDTGVQDVHDAFAGKWIAGAYVGAFVPVDCVNSPDDDGHGSHVASTVLGAMPDDELYGTAKSAKLVEIKISVGIATIGGIARGFDFVKRYNDAIAAGDPLCGPNDDHIDVATLSFGSTGRGGPNAGTDEPFINALVNSGVAVTIAAGNCGPSPSATCSFGDSDNGISSPANGAGAIAVANYDDNDTVNRGNDTIATSSSRGPNNASGDTTAGGATRAADLQDRYRKPEIAAPGTSITAAGPAPFTLNTLSGTSMAAPHVAGIAALLIEAGEDVKDQTGGRNLMWSTGNGYRNDTGEYVPGVYPVRDAIIHSPEYKEAGAEAKWTGPNSAGLQWNNAWGYGQVNAFGAICWAWQNVLQPGGATPPTAVMDGCELTTTNAALNITDPQDGATVSSGVVNVSGVADLIGGNAPKELAATLTGPDKVSNGTAGTYSVTTVNATGDVTCNITAQGTPELANATADGCSVDLTWVNDGTFTVTAEVTDGRTTDTETLDVTVRTPGGIPEPDGTIAGGITIFGANPLLAHNELVALATGPVDPAPKFLPGEAASLHTRFTEDSTGGVKVGVDTFTWHVWTADGQLVKTAGCTSAEDSDTLSPNGFDCTADITLPSEFGRYYTTLQLDRDERWSCHNGEPIVSAGTETGIPECLKAFDIVTETSAGAGIVPGRKNGVPAQFMKAGVESEPGTHTWINSRLSTRSTVSRDGFAAASAPAPSSVPEDPPIVDSTGDVTGAGLPIDHMDVEAAWFDNDTSFLYVGLKLTDIPADSTSTSQIAYHVNFKPEWVTDKTVFGVPAANTFTGLRVQGILSPAGFKGITNPVVKAEHHAELQHLSTTAAPASTSQFGTVAELQLIDVNPDTDIIWWAVPRTALAGPKPGDKLGALSADSVPAVRGLVTLGSFYGDSTPATESTYAFVDTEAPLQAVAGGAYAGAPNSPISISGAGTGGKKPYTCAWTGPSQASFGDAGACDTTVTFSEPGDFTVELTVTDTAGNTASATAPVSVAVPSGERVELFIDGTTSAGAVPISTSSANPTDDWTIPADMSGLAGAHSITARWFDENDALLAEDTISVTVEQSGPEFALDITAPSDGAEVDPDFTVEGTTSGTQSGAAGQRAGARQENGNYERLNLVVDRLVNLETRSSHGPPVPEDSVGIGPGSTLLSEFDGFIGICTAAFVYRDPQTAKVYLAAAGHCFMDTPFTATHGPGADYDPKRTTRVRVCVSTCLGGGSGLGTAAIGFYPSATRTLGALAYARQTGDGGDVGNDFGLVEIPPSLYGEIRTDMPMWNGPSTAENRGVQLGDTIVHYGNAVGLGEVMPTKGRIGIGRGSNANRWLAQLASFQGDSGSAVNIATVDASGVEGQWAAGVLTHIVPGSAAIAGTTMSRAAELALRDARINLELIHDPSQLETTVPGAPSGLSATADNGSVSLSWTAPSNGGAPIESYTVKWGTEPGVYSKSTTASGTSATIGALTNGVTYYFVVSATNAKGEGPDSAEVSATPDAVTTVPGAPGDLAAVAGDGQVALSWSPPASDGGEAITGYTVKWGPTQGGPYAGTLSAADTSATVTGLTNDVEYFFVVTATNAVGEGPVSNEVRATPETFVSPFTVEVRVAGSSDGWVPVDAYDGSAWSKHLTNVSSGQVTVEARLLKDGAEVARDSVNLVVDGTRPTSVGFTDDVAGGGQHTDDATFAARLVDEDGEPISGADLTFELAGEGGRQEWTSTTGANGVASIQRALSMPAGVYDLTVRYGGSEGVYEPHSDHRSFVIEKEATVMDLAVTGKGAKRTATATLTEDDGPAMAGREVVFYADGTVIGRATTNANGVATLKPPQGYRGDHFNFEARFDGTSNFVGSSDSDQT